MPGRITRLFPVFAIAAGIAGYLAPEAFGSLKSAIVPLLALIMFLMGVTLSAADFTRVLRMQLAVLTGVGLQFLIMPASALALTHIFDLGDFAAGVILVGCCSGGTASNLICYLARGDLALSITMTLTTTLIGVFLTPLLAWQLLDVSLAVDYHAMFITIFKIVFLPVLLGIAVNYGLRNMVIRITPAIPALSVAAICAIISIVVALNADRLLTAGASLVLVVMLHNLIGLGLTYQVAGWLGFSESVRRTLAIEVGMQNSGLAVALALKFVTPAAALAGALFSIWHNVSGSILASYWSRRTQIE
ncbi:Pantothenate precursors transporter PanS [BD1-7 clade bacterium]|uniref:Pantothenates transporter PanS n=1 Tax=BD1-7 clade bacterium TaxID=2029982 RepID=A0A5S9P1E5_9GAMM|nr:Pantothenate precursors transporter PanS [BD1-7 clade bacterium]